MLTLLKHFHNVITSAMPNIAGKIKTNNLFAKIKFSSLSTLLWVLSYGELSGENKN